VFAHLVKKIEVESGGHIGTGLIGGQWLNRVLTEGGRPDLAYRLATNTTYPGWGYMVEKGATTIWELWNTDTAPPNMNSRNHVMLVGDLAIWLYEDLAGIKSDPARPGFKHIIMKPHPVGDLTFARAIHRSPYGLIVSDWKRGDGAFDWQITVPPNTTATVYLPTTDAARVTEGGQPINKVKSVTFLRQEAGAAVYTVGAGTYRFRSALPATKI
jgi:alpha-L-rhamnosidase